MLVSDFNFILPEELIAKSPARPRDSAKLLLVNDKLTDLSVQDIPSLINPSDIMIFNDTRVIPARLFGKRGQSRAEITLHKAVDVENFSVWKAFARPARKLNTGNIFVIAEDFSAKVLRREEGEVLLEFNKKGEEFFITLEKYGFPPLPPYITRQNKKPENIDKTDYQTIYARNKGAIAAPTAGLHFTQGILDAIDRKGIKRVFVTLHVGAGTFLPVKAKDTKDHKMHSEYGLLSKETADLLNLTKKNGGRIIAIGTTSLRLLESATDKNGIVQPFTGETDIFITPGYKFKAADVLITNFHIPKSTLFMLVAAFCGLERIQAAYSYAIDKQYRFYSYGDASMLIKIKD